MDGLGELGVAVTSREAKQIQQMGKEIVGLVRAIGIGIGRVCSQNGWSGLGGKRSREVEVGMELGFGFGLRRRRRNRKKKRRIRVWRWWFWRVVRERVGQRR